MSLKSTTRTPVSQQSIQMKFVVVVDHPRYIQRYRQISGNFETKKVLIDFGNGYMAVKMCWVNQLSSLSQLMLKA